MSDCRICKCTKKHGDNDCVCEFDCHIITVYDVPEDDDGGAYSVAPWDE